MQKTFIHIPHLRSGIYKKKKKLPYCGCKKNQRFNQGFNRFHWFFDTKSHYFDQNIFQQAFSAIF